ncbi:MAG: PTS sugar transporter subunit IIA [Spirochaetaceae bacterium]|jgi:PTS system fructose-specific IIC component/PTS system nitrogen regulatory IIA component|nr:PTS sugar transporter subunit IIA [Spirochaetaceae bacterium]
MLLSEIFNEQTIRLELESETKTAVFAELIETLATAHPEMDKTQMLAAVLDREHKMNTAIAADAAVPHGYYPGTDKIIGAIGISKNGIDYGAADNKPVHFVFLLLMGDAVREQHLRILNRVLSLIKSGKLPALKASKNVREAHEILSRF